MRYTPWIYSLCESADDLQRLWRIFKPVSATPLPMMLFMALSVCVVASRPE